MFKKISALLLSASLLSAQFVAVCAENTNETPLLSNPEQLTEYCTDRFIVETKTDTNVSMFSTDEVAVTDADIKNAINDVISETETISNETNVSDVALIGENSNIVTLSENVNADEFVQAVEDTFGDTVIVQPDYPVYMDTVQPMSVASTSENDSSTLREWEENLAQAQELSTGDEARIAILGEYFPYHSYLSETYVDEYNIVNNTNSYNQNITDTQMAAIIHSAAPEAKIIPISVFTPLKDNGGGSTMYYPRSIAYTSDIIKAVHYAQNKGAQIVVCRWYSTSYNAYLEEQMDNANMLFIASAGYHITHTPENTNLWSGDLDEKPLYPACFNIDNLITISSIDDNYNRNNSSNFGNNVIYTWGDKITAYKSNSYDQLYPASGSEAATALTAGVSALVIGKNNSAQNLKNILLQSATTIKYLPGTKNFESYKILNFYDAVNGVVSEKEIEVSIPRNENDYYYPSYGDNWSEIMPIFYEDIKGIASGNYYMALLMGDGTVKIANYNTSPPTLHPFEALNSYGNFVTVPGLSNIKKIVMSPDGGALCAIDENGKLFVWGYGKTLGMNTTEYVEVPTENTTVSNVQDVYMTSDTTWVRTKDENGDIRVYSTGEGIFREGEKLVFDEVVEAKGATYVSLDGLYSKPCAAFIKDGKVYVSDNAAGDLNEDSLFTELPRYSSNNKAAIISVSTYASTVTYGICVLNENGHLQYHTSNSSRDDGLLSIAGTSSDYNVEDIVDISGTILAKKQGEGYVKAFDSMSTNSIGLPTNGKIVSGTYNSYMSPHIYNVFGGCYAVFEDGTMYFAPYYNTGQGYDAIQFRIVTQKTFDEHTIHSIVPVTFEMDYGYEFSEKELEYFNTAYSRVTITLDDGTDVSVPVEWNTNEYDKDTLGTQTITGTMDLPANISKPENLDAEMKITTKVPITDVTNPDNITVDYDTPLSDFESQLAQTVTMTLANGEPANLDVDWDTSKYDPTKSGEQDIYGTVTLTDTISNPYNKRPKTTVVVGNPPPKNIDAISEQEDIYIEYGTELSNLPLPTQVPVTLEDKTTENLDVVWEPLTTYNPVLVGDKQPFTGTLTMKDGIDNPDNKTASVNVIVMPEAIGEIIDIETVYLDADQGVPFEQIPDLPKEVKVTVEGGKTAMVPVVWKNTYDEMLITTTKPQQIFGEVDLTNTMIENSAKIPAMAMISTNKADYVVKSLSPSSAELSVEFGTELDKLLSEENAPKQVTVNLEKEGDSSKTLSLDMDLEILSEDNEEYNAEKVGLHNVIARPVLPSNIKIDKDMYFVLYVDVQAKHQVTKLPTSPRLTTYRYTPASELDIPETITVQLDGDENNTVDIEVKWDMDGYYHSGTVGRDIILGEFINIPKNINIPSKFVPSMSITVEDAEYEIVQFTDAGSEEMYAGYTIEEIAKKLSINEAEAEIKMVGSDYVTHTNIPVIIDYNENEQNYDRTQDSTYVLEYTPDPPEGISNTNDAKYYFTLQTTMVDIDKDELDEFPLMEVKRGTPYEELNIPDKMPIKLVNGKTEMIEMNWDKEMYDPDSDGCIIPSSPKWLPYINHDGVDIMYNISFFDEEDVYTLTSISPSQLPATGAYDVKLGTSLEDIKNMLDIDEVEVTASKGSDERKEMVKFEILAEDNADYLNASTAGNYKIKARLILPDDIHDTKDEKTMLIINVNAYTRTVKTISTVTKTGVPYGTPFNAIGLPEQVKVTFTDGGEPEMINVDWDEKTYSVDSTAKYQQITGTLDKPAYVEVPSGKKAIAIVYMKAATNAQLLSVTPKAETAFFSLRSVFGLNGENELPDDVVEHKYIAEYLNEDGTITTEEFSTFEVIDVE